MIKENYYDVINNIKKSCDKFNRDINSVKLIAVSKTKPIEAIKEVYDLGQRDFGENKVQELLDKVDLLPDDINWHFIGHLQTNKVKYIIGLVKLIHSVDSIKLASKIQNESLKKGVITEILIQINICDEESKFGVSIDKLKNLLEYVFTCSNIKFKGFMFIPPANLNDDELNEVFEEFYNLAIDIKRKYIDNIKEFTLSFGMSSDYEIAIKNNSNLVRVGTNIFGKRNYLQ